MEAHPGSVSATATSGQLIGWWDKMKKVFWTYSLNTATYCGFNEDLL